MPADPACRDESLDGQHRVNVLNEAPLSSIARCAGLVFLVFGLRGGDEGALHLKPRLDGVSITSRRTPIDVFGVRATVERFFYP